jgi:hypothetical protein
MKTFSALQVQLCPLGYVDVMPPGKSQNPRTTTHAAFETDLLIIIRVKCPAAFCALKISHYKHLPSADMNEFVRGHILICRVLRPIWGGCPISSFSSFRRVLIRRSRMTPVGKSLRHRRVSPPLCGGRTLRNNLYTLVGQPLPVCPKVSASNRADEASAAHGAGLPQPFRASSRVRRLPGRRRR